MRLQGATLSPLTRVQICRYAGAMRDFNPIHIDDEFARRAGMPSVIAHGPLTLSRALDTIVAQVGARSVRRLDARFKAPYLPGQSLIVEPTGNSLQIRTAAGGLLAIAELTLDVGVRS